MIDLDQRRDELHLKWAKRCRDKMGLTSLQYNDKYCEKLGDVPFKAGWDAAIITLAPEIERLRKNIIELENAAESWMSDYDKLKEKYEPNVFVLSKGKK